MVEMKWEKIRMEFLSADYGLLLTSKDANRYLSIIEDEIEYNEISMVKVFCKLWPIPRRQVAFGDRGLSNTILELKNIIEKTTGHEYNFVLVNRYRDGKDYIGEHRENEPEIDQNTPIASL